MQSLIHWIGAHTRYSQDIPPLPAGADTVDEFLFGNRVGFCEQISTSLAVMLRSLGIPAREAVGYVPGGYDPITDLYQVHANDAHAWVQVWFPGYGWQDFDRRRPCRPAPQPRRHRVRDVGWPCGRIPPVPVAVVVVAAGLVVVLVRWRRARPVTWAERVARASSGPAGVPAGPAGPPRRWPNTPGGSTTSRAETAPHGAGWPRQRRPAPTGGSTRPRGHSAPSPRGRAGTGSARDGPTRPMHPGDRPRNCEADPVTPRQFPRRSVPLSSLSRSYPRPGSLLVGCAAQVRRLNVIGSRAGPQIPKVDGFHSTSPLRASLGRRRASNGSASCSSARASAAPMQKWMPAPNVICAVSAPGDVEDVGIVEGLRITVGAGQRGGHESPLREQHVAVDDVLRGKRAVPRTAPR